MSVRVELELEPLESDPTSCSSRQDAARLASQESFATLNQDLQRFISAYAAGQSSLSDLVMTASSTTTNAVTSHIDEALSNGLESLHLSAQREESRRRLLASLKFAGMNERRNHVSESYRDTFRWVFEDAPGFGTAGGESNTGGQPPSQKWPSFPQWLSSKPEADGTIYWISGKPGSGKSTLFRFMVTSPDLSTLLNSIGPETLLLTHYLWRPGTEMQQNTKGLLCSLLHQFLDAKNGLSTLDELALASPRDQDSDWSVRDLQSTLFRGISTFPGTVCIFIDGLDEVSVKDGPSALLRLVKDLDGLPNTKLCVSSRPEPQIRRHLDKCPTLRVHELTAADLRKFVKGSLNVPSGDSTNKWLGVVNNIVAKSEGVFLWARLVLSSVQSGIDNEDSPAEIETRINSLPSDMGDLYQEMWQRLNDDRTIYRQSAALYFNLVTTMPLSGKIDHSLWLESMPTVSSAPRTTNRTFFPWMSVLELAMASHNVSWDAGTSTSDRKGMCEKTVRDVEIRCAGLLEVVPVIDPSDNAPRVSVEADYLGRKVQFIHRTAQDFFTTEQGLKILAHDTLTPDERFLRLVHAAFHWTERFALGDSVFHHGADYVYTAVKVFQNLRGRISERAISCALLICEEWYSTYSMAAKSEPLGVSSYTKSPRFITLLATHGFRTEVYQRVVKSNYNPEVLSAALFGACSSPVMPQVPLTPTICHLIQDLLSWGASTSVPGTNPYYTAPLFCAGKLSGHRQVRPGFTPLGLFFGRTFGRTLEQTSHTTSLLKTGMEELLGSVWALANSMTATTSTKIPMRVDYSCPMEEMVSPGWPEDHEAAFGSFKGFLIDDVVSSSTPQFENNLSFTLILEFDAGSLASLYEQCLRYFLEGTGTVRSWVGASHTSQPWTMGVSCRTALVQSAHSNPGERASDQQYKIESPLTDPQPLMEKIGPWLFEWQFDPTWEHSQKEREWAKLVFEDLLERSVEIGGRQYVNLLAEHLAETGLVEDVERC